MRYRNLTIAASLLAALTFAPVATGQEPATQEQESRFGAGVTDRDATAIDALYASPADYVGKTIRLDGVVTSVCTEMGCWMALAPADQPERTVRIKVDHGAGIMFPLSARGRQASAEGVFERITADDEEGQNAAAEQGATGAGAEFNATYQIKATGAVVR